jgi:hypothetical protein
MEVFIYPNPASNAVSVSFLLDETQVVSVNIVDANRQIINILHEGRLEKGQHKLNWNAESIKDGIYFLQFVSGEHIISKEISIIH